jgi:hypothetical protein
VVTKVWTQGFALGPVLPAMSVGAKFLTRQPFENSQLQAR